MVLPPFLPFVAALLTGASYSQFASAGTVVYDGYSWNGSGVNITSPNDISGGAGQIQLYTPSGGVIDAWCVDIFNYLQGSGVFETGPLTTDSSPPPGGPIALSSTQVGEIGALVDHGDFLVLNPGLYSSADVSMAIQIAIWSVEYPRFSYTGGDGVVQQLVSDYVGQVENGYWAPYFNVIALSAPGDEGLLANQTLITTSVPELSSWAMMLLGFAGLGFAGVRRESKGRRPLSSAR